MVFLDPILFFSCLLYILLLLLKDFRQGTSPILLDKIINVMTATSKAAFFENIFHFFLQNLEIFKI